MASSAAYYQECSFETKLLAKAKDKLNVEARF